jgi:protein-S-isoprenylcysteine O-methyltransferase Ste14
VDTGVCSISRNPLYLGIVAILLGAILAAIMKESKLILTANWQPGSARTPARTFPVSAIMVR